MRRLGRLKHTYESGQMQVVADDVLNIVRKVQDISPRLTIYWNDHIDQFTITETSLDGAEERLVFSVPVLDERVLDRLLVADQWCGRDDPEHLLPEDEDMLSSVEEEEARIEKMKLEHQRGVMSEPIAAYASYMELDGRGTKASIILPRGVNNGSHDSA